MKIQLYGKLNWKEKQFYNELLSKIMLNQPKNLKKSN